MKKSSVVEEMCERYERRQQIIADSGLSPRGPKSRSDSPSSPTTGRDGSPGDRFKRKKSPRAESPIPSHASHRLENSVLPHDPLAYDGFLIQRAQMCLDLACKCSTLASPQTLSVFIMTYNAGVSRPNEKSLATIRADISGAALGKKGTGPDKMIPLADLPDILAFGFQEVDMSQNAMLNEQTKKGSKWANAVAGLLGPSFVEISREQLVGLMLVVFAKSEHEGWIRNKHTSKPVRTGAYGFLGNKGGFGLRFSLYGKTFLFIASHFAAHSEMVEARNENYKSVLEDLHFPEYDDFPCADDMLDRCVAVLPPHHSFQLLYGPRKHPEGWKPREPKSPDTFDYTFWFGDLNYRIDLSNETVRQAILHRNWDFLKRYDQLTIQKQKKNVFHDFEEGPIDFAPTYKYDIESDIYDTSQKARVPSWTDRILYRIGPNTMMPSTLDFAKNVLHQRYYRRLEITQSDHRPVVSRFDVQCMQFKESVVEEQLRLIVSRLTSPPRRSSIPSILSGEAEGDGDDEPGLYRTKDTKEKPRVHRWLHGPHHRTQSSQSTPNSSISRGTESAHSSTSSILKQSLRSSTNHYASDGDIVAHM